MVSCSDEITVLKRYSHPTPRLKVCEASEGPVDEDEDIDWQLTASEIPQQTPLGSSVKISSVSSEYGANVFREAARAAHLAPPPSLNLTHDAYLSKTILVLVLRHGQDGWCCWGVLRPLVQE